MIRSNGLWGKDINYLDLIEQDNKSCLMMLTNDLISRKDLDKKKKKCFFGKAKP